MSLFKGKKQRVREEHTYCILQEQARKEKQAQQRMQNGKKGIGEVAGEGIHKMSSAPYHKEDLNFQKKNVSTL